MDWDEGQVFTNDLNLPGDGETNRNDLGGGDDGMTPARARLKFKEFIRTFHRTGSGIFTYRERLLQNVRRGVRSMNVKLSDLNFFGLQDLLMERPAVFLPEFEKAAEQVANELAREDDDANEEDENDVSPDKGGFGPIQITLSSDQESVPIRQMNASHVNKLVKIPGIVISASRTRPKAITVNMKCRSCGHVRMMQCKSAFGQVSMPRTCSRERLQEEKECPLDPYVVIPDRCEYIDIQSLKVQESPEVVPTGEMPRHILLSADRSLSNRLTPGTRVVAIGIYDTFNSGAKKKLSAVAIRTPYLRVVGLELDSTGLGHMGVSYSPEEEEQLLELSRQPDLYDKIVRSIAPSISGDYTDDIKRAIACLLFGGSRKVLPDGMSLRGDINVLLLGDPSTAKSQFLKFGEKVAPIGVYTSGKGSSAAGLTASVIKDSRGEFYLEGGAMVLADGGVVCIDEFDKMREQDRVAIHEAMEQQTISVAKAGITTVLNSRVSVLAAANPVYGRYDDERSAAENIDFLPTILSRFDLIFIVRDIRDEKRDRFIARHVVDIHISATSAMEGAREGEIDLETMKKYIAYCRRKRAPRLSMAATETLRNHYVKIRSDMRKQSIRNGGDSSTIPITVRQLEAIVRIAESLAKMSLSREATVDHVEEAIRLFKVSTISAAKSGVASMAFGSPEMRKNVQMMEAALKNRIAIGRSVSVRKLREDFSKQGFGRQVIDMAIQASTKRGDMQYHNQRKFLRRRR